MMQIVVIKWQTYNTFGEKLNEKKTKCANYYQQNHYYFFKAFSYASVCCEINPFKTHALYILFWKVE
jgi:hypothetical protein